MVSTSRFNYAILGIATMWSVLIFILYSNSSASCSAETERLKMAVDRKDRFLELLRDQNDELKGKVSKLQTNYRNMKPRKAHKRICIVSSEAIVQLNPTENNKTLRHVLLGYK